MKVYSGMASCPVHGSYEWRFNEKENGEVAIYRLDDALKNVHRHTKMNDGSFSVITTCPTCGRENSCTTG